jgi:hypothetical protein
MIPEHEMERIRKEAEKTFPILHITQNVEKNARRNRRAYEIGASAEYLRNKNIAIKSSIDERRLIVYVLETSLLDEEFTEDYRKALRDEIVNHKLAIEEYEEALKQLNG